MNTAQPFELPLAFGREPIQMAPAGASIMPAGVYNMRVKSLTVKLLPVKGSTSLVLDHAGFKEIAFLL